MEITNAVIDRIIYEANNFTVVSVKTSNNRFVATLNQRCRKGQKMNLHGDWVVHKKYGRQFKVIQTEIPENITSTDVEIFLQNISGNTITIYLDDMHTHCGVPDGDFDLLIKSLYDLLINNRGLSWA